LEAVPELSKFAHSFRSKILKNSLENKKGHVGSSFSVLDILISLKFCGLLQHSKNHFVLSKGHAFQAFRMVLELDHSKSNSDVPELIDSTHPSHMLRDIEFSTGSLGQGICFAAGLAYSHKYFTKSNSKITCLISDAELNSGSTFETFQFIIQHKLDNLVIIIDNNGQQALDRTVNVVNTKPFVESLTGIGFKVINVDGHNFESLVDCFCGLKFDLPTVINCNTISGHPITFMMKEIPWHYKNVDLEEYNNAIQILKDYYA
jgi:transketolase